MIKHYNDNNDLSLYHINLDRQVILKLKIYVIIFSQK